MHIYIYKIYKYYVYIHMLSYNEEMDEHGWVMFCQGTWVGLCGLSCNAARHFSPFQAENQAGSSLCLFRSRGWPAIFGQ
jgi:hypothetical protein